MLVDVWEKKKTTEAKFLFLRSSDLQPVCLSFVGALAHPPSSLQEPLFNFTDWRSREVDDFWQDSGWAVLLFSTTGFPRCDVPLPACCILRPIYTEILHEHNCNPAVFPAPSAAGTFTHSKNPLCVTVTCTHPAPHPLHPRLTHHSLASLQAV